MKRIILFLIIALQTGLIVHSQVFIKNLRGPSQWPTSAAISNDGSKLYVGSYDRNIWVFSLVTGEVTDTLRYHSGAVTSLAISTRGMLASGSWDMHIALWEKDKKQPIFMLSGHKEKVNSVQFSPDGKILGSVGDDGNLIIWDVITGGIIKTISAHSEPATSLCFRSDGKVIATGSWDKTVRLWNVTTGELMTEFKGHTNSVNHVMFSKNDRFLVSSSDDNSMIVWETLSNTAYKKFDFYRKPVSQAIFINNDNQLLSIDQQGELKIYNMNNHQLLVVKSAHTGKIRGMAWYPEQGLLVTVGEDLNISQWDMSEYTYYECLKKKTPGIDYLKKPKGEFETTEQYEARMKNYETRKLSLVDECRKDAMIEKQALEKMRLEKEAEAFSWSTVPLTNIGTYDADNEDYPVMIGQQTYILKMTPEEARLFKENWQKARIKAVRKDLGSGAFIYYNLEMEHPVSKKKYLFGEQISAVSDPAYKVFSEKKR